jgi:DNA polymerase III delta' subunit
MPMNVLQHDQTKAQLDAITSTRTGSYIFHGSRAVGKATSARQLARQLNCTGDEPATCAHCHQFDAGNYPDYLVVRPKDKPSILIEQIRSLIQALSLSLYHPSGVRIVLIDDAEQMTVEAQNALLKLIEEPPPQTIFLLVTERLESLLPTVRSRCIQIYFPTLPSDQIAAILTRTHGVPGAQAAELAAAATGAPGVAVALATQPDDAQTYLELIHQATSTLTRSPFERLLLANRLVAAKADLARFGQLLHALLVNQLRSGDGRPQTIAHQLEALEQFRRHLQAKVTLRVAVERLMLEL